MKLVNSYKKIQEQSFGLGSKNSENNYLNIAQMEKAIRYYLDSRGIEGNEELKGIKKDVREFLRKKGIGPKVKMNVPFEKDKHGREIYYRIDNKGDFLLDDNDNYIVAVNPKYQDELEQFGLDVLVNDVSRFEDLYDTRPSHSKRVRDRTIGAEIFNAYKKNVDLIIKDIFSGIVGKGTKRKGSGDFRNLLNKTPGKFELLIYKPEYWDYTHPDIKSAKGAFISLPITHHKGDIKNLYITNYNFTTIESRFEIISPPNGTIFYIDEIYKIKLQNPTSVRQLENYKLKESDNIFKIKVAGFNDHKTTLDNTETEIDILQDDDFIKISDNAKCIYYSIKEIAYALLRIGEMYRKNNKIVDNLIDKNFSLNLTKVLNTIVFFSQGRDSIIGYYKKNISYIERNFTQKEFSLPVFLNFIKTQDKDIFVLKEQHYNGCEEFFKTSDTDNNLILFDTFYVESLEEYFRKSGDVNVYNKNELEKFYLNLISKIILEFISTR